MFRRLPLTLGAAALAAASLIPLPPAQAAAPGKRHVVVFGLDGVRWDVLRQVNAPTIKSLIAQGYASQTWLYSSPLAQTSSGPGWATNLTGVWPDEHKVKDNSFSGNDLKSHPDFLTRVEQSSSAFSTYAALDWKPIGDRIITGGIDRKFVLDGDADGYTVDDPKVAADASAHLKNNGPHASFVYFGNPDIAGHNSGGASAAYRAAIETADRQIGQVIAAAKSRPTYAQEEWAFMVTIGRLRAPPVGYEGKGEERCKGPGQRTRCPCCGVAWTSRPTTG